MDRIKGTIARTDIEKNYGWIYAPGKGKDFFFHGGSFAPGAQVAFKDLERGDWVEFEPTYPERGPRATLIVLLCKAGDYVPQEGTADAEDEDRQFNRKA